MKSAISTDSEGLRISDPPQHLKENKMGYFLRFWGAQNFWSPQHLKLTEISYFHRFWGAQNFWSPQHLKQNKIGYFSDSEGLRFSDLPTLKTERNQLFPPILRGS